MDESSKKINLWEFRDFENMIVEEDDHLKLCIYSCLIFDNWTFSSKKCRQWTRVIKKISKIFEKFDGKYFKDGFQFIDFEEEDRVVICCLCNLLQRIYNFAEDPVIFKGIDKLVKLAFCFDIDVSISALKALYMVGEVFNLSKAVPIYYEILFKLAELDVTLHEVFPNVKDKIYEPFENIKTGDHSYDYFHKCLANESYSDLYISYIKLRNVDNPKYLTILKQSSIIILFQNLDSDEYYHRLSLTYSILDLESDRETIKEINCIENNKKNSKLIIDNNINQKVTMQAEFIFSDENYIWPNNIDKNKNEYINTVKEHLNYFQNIDFEFKYSFERYLVFSSAYNSSFMNLVFILELNKEDGLFYTAIEGALSCPSHDKISIVAIMEVLVNTEFKDAFKKEIICEILFKYLDMPANDILRIYLFACFSFLKESEDFCLKTLEHDVVNVFCNYLDKNFSEGDSCIMSLILDILFYLYKKSNTRLEPFEESRFLKFCINSIQVNHPQTVTKCYIIITYFINSDPLCIESLLKSGIDDIFTNIQNNIKNEQEGINCVNFLDALSLNIKYGKSLRERKVFTAVLNGLDLYKERGKSSDSNLVEFMSIFLRHHPEYINEYIDFHFDSLKILYASLDKSEFFKEDVDFLVNFMETFRRSVSNTFIKQPKESIAEQNELFVKLYSKVARLKLEQKSCFVSLIQSFVSIFKFLNNERVAIKLVLIEIKSIILQLNQYEKKRKSILIDYLETDEEYLRLIIVGERYLSLISALINSNFTVISKDQQLFGCLIESCVALFLIGIKHIKEMYDKGTLSRTFISAYLCLISRINKDKNDLGIHCLVICLNLITNLKFGVEEFCADRSFVKKIFVDLFLNKLLVLIKNDKDINDNKKRIKYNEISLNKIITGPLDIALNVFGHILEGFNQDVIEEFCFWLKKNEIVVNQKHTIKLKILEQLEYSPFYNLTKKSKIILFTFLDGIDTTDNDYKLIILKLVTCFNRQLLSIEDKEINLLFKKIVKKNYYLGCNMKFTILMEEVDFVIDNFKKKHYNVFIENISEESLDFIVFLLNYHYEDSMLQLLKTTVEILTFIKTPLKLLLVNKLVKKGREVGLFTDSYDFEVESVEKIRSKMEDENYYMQIDPNFLQETFNNTLEKAIKCLIEIPWPFFIICSKYFEVRLSKFGFLVDTRVLYLCVFNNYSTDLQTTMSVMHHIFAGPDDLIELKKSILDKRSKITFYGLEEEEYDYFPLVYRNPNLITSPDKFPSREETPFALKQDIVCTSPVWFTLLMNQAIFNSNELFILSEIVYNYPKYMEYVNFIHILQFIHNYLGQNLKYLKNLDDQTKAKRLFEFLAVCFHTLDDRFIESLSEYVRIFIKEKVEHLCNIILILYNVSNPIITLSSGVEEQNKDKNLYLGIQKLFKNGTVDLFLSTISNVDPNTLPNLKEFIQNSETLVNDLGIKNFHSFLIQNRLESLSNFSTSGFNYHSLDDIAKSSDQILNIALNFIFNVIYLSHQKEIEDCGVLDSELSDEEGDSGYDPNDDGTYDEEEEEDNYSEIISSSSRYEASQEEDYDNEEESSSNKGELDGFEKITDESSLVVRSAYLRYETEFKLVGEENRKIIFDSISKIIDLININRPPIEEDVGSSSTKTEEDERQIMIVNDGQEENDSSVSSIGVYDGFIPDLSISDICQLNDIQIDQYVSDLTEQRKSNNIEYHPIDKEFLDHLEPRVRQIFIHYEEILKDFYSPVGEFISEGKEKEVESIDIQLNLSKESINSFINAFLDDKFTCKPQVFNVFKLMSICKNTRLNITEYSIKRIVEECNEIQREEIYVDIQKFERIRKLIELVKLMIVKHKMENISKQDYHKFIKSLFGLICYKEVCVKVVALLNILYFDSDIFNENDTEEIAKSNSEETKRTLVLQFLNVINIWINKKTTENIKNIINKIIEGGFHMLSGEIIRRLGLKLEQILAGEENLLIQRFIEEQHTIYNIILLFNLCFSSFFECFRNKHKDSLEALFFYYGTECRNLEDLDLKVVLSLNELGKQNKISFGSSSVCGKDNLILIIEFTNLIQNKLERIIEIICAESSTSNDRYFSSGLFNVYFMVFSTYEKFLNFYIITFDKDSELLETHKTYETLKFNLNNLLKSNIQEINGIFASEVDLFKKNIRFLSRFNIINFTNKNNYFRGEVHEMELYKEGTYSVNIRKDNILGDSLFQIMNKTPKEFKSKRLQIKFSGEEGVDFGGLTREWFDLLVKAILNPDLGLFVYTSEKKNTVLPYRNSNINSDHLLYFKFIGRILAKAILDRTTLDLQIDKSAFKYFLGKKCELSDLENVDPQFYNSLIWMQNNSIENIVFQTFSTDFIEFGESHVVDLKPNGRNILVTDANKLEYIKLITEYKLFKGIEVQLNALKQGLFEIIDLDLLSIFNENELGLLINGIPDINVDDWINNTEYYGYKNNSSNIIWFWRAVKSFTPEERAKLLQFCTGSSRVPYEGFSHLQGNNGPQKFSIHKSSSDKIRLPSAHTCFNQLDLPEYSSYAELRRSVIYAINECSEGFGLV